MGYGNSLLLAVFLFQWSELRKNNKFKTNLFKAIYTRVSITILTDFKKV